MCAAVHPDSLHSSEGWRGATTACGVRLANTQGNCIFVNYTCFTSVGNEAKPPPVHVVDLHPPVSHFFACTFSLS